MAAPTVTRADAERIARQYGAAGKAAPAWVQDDSAYLAAYHGAGGSDPAPAPAPSSSAAPAPAKRPAQTRPARSASRAGRNLARSRSARPGYFGRAFSPTAAANRLGGSKITSGGDAGGLLLALIIYPIFLSVLKYGADGPGKWFRAKWLNDVPGFDPSKIAPVNPGSKIPNYSGGTNDGDSINFVDTKGDYGPRGATYPNGVWHSPQMILSNGTRQTNPHYVGPGTPSKANI